MLTAQLPDFKIADELLDLPSSAQRQYFGFQQEQRIHPVPNTDSVIQAAIQLSDGRKTEDYWMTMRLDPSESESSRNSIGTLYTSTGRTFVFESTQSALHTTLHGPINLRKLEKTPVQTFEIRVNDDYLSLGLHRLHEFFEAATRYREHYPESEKLSYTIRSTPFEDPSQLFPEEIIEISNLSEASERAFVGALPALGEFFSLVYETEGLKDILMELIPKSALLGLLNPFSDSNIGFSYGTPRPSQISASTLDLGLETVGVIPVALSIGSKQLLDLKFYTTAPTYEWKTCAGIVAIEVYSSLKPEKRCLIRAFPHQMIQSRIRENEIPTDSDQSRVNTD